MGTISRGVKAGGGTNYNSGQTIDPTEVNLDVNTAYTAINGNLDDANITTAKIPGAKSLRFTSIVDPAAPAGLDVLSYTKSGEFYYQDSNGVVLPIRAVYARTTGSPITDVTSTVAETTITTQSLAANVLTSVGGVAVSNRVLVVHVWADILNSTGASRGFVIRFKLAGSTFATLDSTGLFTTNATRRVAECQSKLVFYGATNAQLGFAVMTSVLGVTASSNPLDVSVYSGLRPGAIDGTATNSLTITVQPEVNSASLSFRPFHVETQIR